MHAGLRPHAARSNAHICDTVASMSMSTNMSWQSLFSSSRASSHFVNGGIVRFVRLTKLGEKRIQVLDEDAKDEEKNPTGIVWMQIVNYRVVPDERHEKAEFYVRTDHAGNHRWMSSKDMALGFMAAQVSSQLELCFEKVKSSFGTREAIKWVQLLIRDREERLKATQTLWSPYNVSAWW